MPSTHVSLYVHFVFSTKERRRWIKESWEHRMCASLGGITRKLGGVALAVGGDEDHVHVLASLKATHCPADIMRELKSNSSAWVHNVIGIRSFDWQDGYGAFTIGCSDVAAIKKYIQEQKEHHRRKTFQEEYLELLKGSGIEFNEKYLW
jgi:putative transposase